MFLEQSKSSWGVRLYFAGDQFLRRYFGGVLDLQLHSDRSTYSTFTRHSKRYERFERDERSKRDLYDTASGPQVLPHLGVLVSTRNHPARFFPYTYHNEDKGAHHPRSKANAGDLICAVAAQTPRFIEVRRASLADVVL